MADTNALLAKIRKMLDLAESEAALGNDEAAAAHKATAERWMAKHRIEEEELIAADPLSVLPVWGDSPVTNRTSQYRNQYFDLFYYIANHTGVKVQFEWKSGSEGTHMRGYTVGYEADLRYAEALFTNARMVFADKLEPSVNRSLPEEDNIYRLRSAGVERVRIADLVWGMGSRYDKKLLSKVGRVYAAECKRRGEEPAVAGRGVTGAAYREQYAEQFVATFALRLRQARDAAGRAGGGLVLHGRSERVQEAFYERFPHLRPKPAVEAGSNSAVAERCAKCAKAKSGFCREHRPSYARVPQGRDYYSAAAERGRAAGAAAARHVDLGRGGTGTIGGV